MHWDLIIPQTNSTRNMQRKLIYTRNWCLKPKLWKIIQSECKQTYGNTSSRVFNEFIEHLINQPFTMPEITAAIKLLKNNKAGGVDNVINEFFKYCNNDFLELIVDFFNIVLNTGYVPTEWCLGIICPLYKNKGSVDDPDHYRGITLLSCTCKLFTACINTRLSNYVDDDILGKEQAGFRKGYSTIDHVFVLHLVIDLYQSVRKRVFCAFIDYQKAFDSVNRSLLWQKIVSYNINGKLLTVIRQMYNRAKSCIKKDNMISEYFLCNIGVRLITITLCIVY